MKQFILALLLTAASSVAFASTVSITFTALPATQGNGTAANQSTPADYSYNGEVPATIAGIPNQLLICDDFDQTTYVPSGAIDFSVATLSDLSSAMFTGGFVTGLTGESNAGMTEVQAYDTAAVLVSDIENLGAENSGDAQQVADYNYALWDLMEPNGTNDGIPDSPLDTNATNYLQTAFTAATAASPTVATTSAETDLVIYTPVSSSANQEFLGISTSTPQTGNQTGAPEPSTWILMAGLGLFLCIPRLRSRLRAVVARG